MSVWEFLRVNGWRVIAGASIVLTHSCANAKPCPRVSPSIAASGSASVKVGPDRDAGSGPDSAGVPAPLVCVDANPQEVAGCGIPWNPSQAFLAALATLREKDAWLAEREFLACTASDPFCTYGVALCRKWFGRIEQFQTIAQQILGSGKIDACVECRILILRDLGWSQIVNSEKTRASGIKNVNESCAILTARLLYIHLYGHASPCRLALGLRETTDQQNTRMLATQEWVESCDQIWRNSCAEKTTKDLFLAEIWW